MRKLICMLAVAILATAGDGSTERPPISPDALQYLLKRKEYDRFDWYVDCYLKRHPDNAVLHTLRGYRYFGQATETEIPLDGRDHGRIGRHYTQPKILFTRAFEALDRARQIEPNRRGIYLAACRMAAEAGLSAKLEFEISRILDRFGCGQDIVDLMVDFVRTQSGGDELQATLKTLGRIRRTCPGDHRISTEMGRLFWVTGRLDSAAHYLHESLREAPRNASVFKNAISLACASEDFAQAYTLALRLYEISQDPTDLEQAAVCAYAYDTAKANVLYRHVVGLPEYKDSASAARWFFEEALAKPLSEPRRSFFAGPLFHLNFALFAVDHQRNRDRAAYYLHKARAFYVHAVREIPPTSGEIRHGFRPFGSSTLL
ncbi:MAG: hypothetical protein GF344_14605, partial [Chitinivibrionales bacterium]|nr:hypothetical protein [Chitinivibrionales bacterium]MBD3357951.1 hypothetical protein [Chitinivibrionales bacterium]